MTSLSTSSDQPTCQTLDESGASYDVVGFLNKFPLIDKRRRVESPLHPHPRAGSLIYQQCNERYTSATLLHLGEIVTVRFDQHLHAVAAETRSLHSKNRAPERGTLTMRGI